MNQWISALGWSFSVHGNHLDFHKSKPRSFVHDLDQWFSNLHENHLAGLLKYRFLCLTPRISGVIGSTQLLLYWLEKDNTLRTTTVTLLLLSVVHTTAALDLIWELVRNAGFWAWRYTESNFQFNKISTQVIHMHIKCEKDWFMERHLFSLWLFKKQTGWHCQSSCDHKWSKL